MKKFFRKTIYILGGTLILMFASFHNHYPLCSSETANTISNVFGKYSAQSNSIFYDFFFKIICAKESLWYVVYFQNLLLSIILYIFINIFKWKNNYLSFILFTAIITYFATLSWYSNLISADIYTSIGILIIFIFYLKPEIKITEKIFLSVVLLFSVLAYNFDNIIFLLFTLIIIILSYKNKNFKIFPKKNIRIVLSVLFLSVITYFATDYFSNENLYLFDSVKTNQTKTMISSGLMTKILKDKCKNNNFKICKLKKYEKIKDISELEKKYKKKYKNSSSEDLNEELEKIRKISFSKNYLSSRIINGTISFFKQLKTFNIRHYLPKKKKYKVLKSIKNHHIKYEYNEFINSKQFNYTQKEKKTKGYKKRLLLIQAKNKELFTIIISILLLTYIFSLNNKKINIFKNLVVYLAIFIILNSLILSLFAGVSFRNTGKIIWLLPFLTLITIFQNSEIFVKHIKFNIKKLNKRISYILESVKKNEKK